MLDEPNLITDAGLVAALALAEQIGLPELMAEPVVIHRWADSTGVDPSVKVMSPPAGMVAGADSIDDLDRLRHADKCGDCWHRPCGVLHGQRP